MLLYEEKKKNQSLSSKASENFREFGATALCSCRTLQKCHFLPHCWTRRRTRATHNHLRLPIETRLLAVSLECTLRSLSMSLKRE